MPYIGLPIFTSHTSNGIIIFILIVYIIVVLFYSLDIELIWILNIKYIIIIFTMGNGYMYNTQYIKLLIKTYSTYL